MEESKGIRTPLMQNNVPYSGATNSGMTDSTGESDPMIKDKKRLEMAGIEVIPIFIANVFILLPIWIAILLPLTLIYQGLLYIFIVVTSALGLKKKSKKADAAATNVTASANVTQKKGDSAYDLVIFGATGFTGQMAATYIAKRYGNKFKWAIAGRRMSALQELRSKLSAIDSSLSALPIIIADTNDIASLEAMVKMSKVVISTTGEIR
jgi:Saccharopine dehydrogenase NADP binding domain